MAGITDTARGPQRPDPAPARPAPARRPRFGNLIPSALRITTDDARLVDGRVERDRKDWALDLVAAVLTILVGVVLHLDAIDGAKRPAQVLLVLDVALLPVAVVLLFFRRRWPLAIAGIFTVMSAVVPSVALGALIVTFAVASWSRPPRGLIGIGLLLVSVPIVAALWPNLNAQDGNPTGSYLSDVIFGCLVTIVAGVWGLFAGARRQLMASLQERAVRAESEQALRVDQARAQERTRIAREMHDVLAHRMSLLSVHAGALEFRPDAPPEQIAHAAGVIRATAHEALEELRTVIGVMRVGDAVPENGPDAPAMGRSGTARDASGDRARDGMARLAPEPPQPTLSAVPHLVEQWREAGARIDLQLDQDALSALPATIGRTAYRLVQEALTNAGKHAPTALIDVRVTGEPGDALVVTVANPLGVGLPDRHIPGTGLGLVGLRERTELVGGVFAAGVDEDLRRFVLEARLPWPTA